MANDVDRLQGRIGVLEATLVSECDQKYLLVAEINDLKGRIEALEAALREAERFVSYLANETDGHFVGSGTPTTCLVMIRAALAPD